MRKFLLPFVLGLAACATSQLQVSTQITGGLQAAMVSFREAESRIVCGRATAPPAGECVPEATHAVIKEKLKDAFALHQGAVDIIGQAPANKPTPQEALSLIGRIAKIVADVLTEIPASAQKDAAAGSISVALKNAGVR